MIIKNAKVFNEAGFFENRDIFMEDGIIKERGKDIKEDEVVDAAGLYAIPGLTDIHFHGCMGYDFCDGNHEAISAIADYEARNGVTTICPATMTLSPDRIYEICAAAGAYHSEKGAILCGINMEGPFISEEKKGAQNSEYIQNPNQELLLKAQQAAGGLIKLVAIAPEIPGAMEFISAQKENVVLSIAHTTADYDIAGKAMAEGARHVTHLYNAMPPLSHRAPGVIGAAFDRKDCEVELICDGIHIHPSVIRATFQIFGEDRIILISDSMEATGLSDGEYSLGGQPVFVKGNLCTLEDGTIAGSGTNLMDCLRVAVKTVGIDLATAVKCATVNPAKSIGIYEQYGSLEAGKAANIVLLDEDLNIKSVYINGRKYA